LTPLTISGSVGAGGANRPEDVRQVQEALTTLGYLPAGYTPGQIDAATINAISNYQQTNHLPVVDGRIDVNLYTMRHINQQAVGLTATPATGPQTQPAAGPQTQTVAGPQPPVTLPPVTGAGDARVAELQQRAVATARGEWQAGVHERPNGSNSGPRVDQYAARAGFGPGHEWCGFFTGFALSENGFKDPSKLASYQKARDYFMYRDYTARTNSPVNQRNDELRAQHAAQGSSRQYFMLEESPTRQRVEQPGSWGRGRYGHYDADANTFNYQNIPVRGGDVVLFNRGHVGLVESYNPATGRLVTIEGNASGTGPDGRRANNAVVRREYDLTDPAVRRQFDGFGRPAAGDFR